MNEKVKAIRNEIERRMEKHWDLLPDADSPEDDWTHNSLCELGAYKELEHLFTFIDSLPESKCPKLSDNLEEAAEFYAKDVIPLSDKEYINHIEYNAFIAGANWQKEQMMKDAVEGYVNYYEDSGGILMAEAQVGYPYHNGEKVRIIIVKEDEQ